MTNTDGPCRCWARPGQVHGGHCCNKFTDFWCHIGEGKPLIAQQQEDE